jgi:hypothetical protein
MKHRDYNTYVQEEENDPNLNLYQEELQGDVFEGQFRCNNNENKWNMEGNSKCKEGRNDYRYHITYISYQ